MASAQIGNIHGVAAASVGNQTLGSANFIAPNVNGGSNATTGLNMNNVITNAIADTRLNAIASGFYGVTQGTALRTNTMSYNDKMFAIRTNDFAASIKQ